MKMSLRLRIQLFFAAIIAGVIGMTAVGLVLAKAEIADPAAFSALVQGAIIAIIGVSGLVGLIAFLFDRNVAKPIEAIASAMRARVHADVAREINPLEGRYLGDLTAAVRVTTSTLSTERNALAESIARETTRLSGDKNRLEHLLADVPPAVLLCTGRHRLVFYNGQTQRLLADAETPVCLDRSLFDYLDDGPVRAAHRQLMETGSPEAVVEFVCTTPTGARRLAGRMRLAAENGGAEGAYVMTLRDVTLELSAFARRDALLEETFERMREAVDDMKAAEPDALPGELKRLSHELGMLEDKFEAQKSEADFTFSMRLKPGEVMPAGVSDPLHSVVYDFDLLARSQPDAITRARLDALSYVVFDTETTGLLPDQGDELVQIAAVRIVAGKRVKSEVFETLVNPGRPIPPASIAFHGVTDAMVEKAPRILEAVERFHRFAEGAVLVAHNAPFDMEFLYRRERQIGKTFANPVLDTVSLSAVVFGEWEDHSLDALTDRLGVELPENLRHTALGDAVATADTFLKLKTILEGKGLERFEDVLNEARRHGKLVKDLNSRVAV